MKRHLVLIGSAAMIAAWTGCAERVQEAISPPTAPVRAAPVAAPLPPAPLVYVYPYMPPPTPLQTDGVVAGAITNGLASGTTNDAPIPAPPPLNQFGGPDPIQEAPPLEGAEPGKGPH